LRFFLKLLLEILSSVGIFQNSNKTLSVEWLRFFLKLLLEILSSVGIFQIS